MAPFAAALGDPSRLRMMLDALSESVYLVDRDRTIRFWNRACEETTGYTRAEVVGRRCFHDILHHVDEHGRLLCDGMCPLAHTMRDRAARGARVWMRHKAGHRLPVRMSATALCTDDGTVIGAMESFTYESPGSAGRERMVELEQQAMLDPLTGVPNRRFLDITLAHCLEEVHRHGASFVVVLADIDRFKRVNDLHGHAVGDRMLQMVAATLAANVRGGDMVARYGGDEFVLLLRHDNDGQAAAAAERLRNLVRSSGLGLPAIQLNVTVSLGVTRAQPNDGPRSVIARADALLYDSKRAGRNRLTSDFQA